MTNDLTLIETDVLDELLEKAFAYDIISEDNQLMYEEDWNEINKQIEIKKNNFLNKYVNIPIELDETIIDGLEKIGYK